MSLFQKNEDIAASKRQEISADDISRALDEFGTGPPYEVQTRATRRTSGGDNMCDPLNAKLGLAATTEPSTDAQNDVKYMPAITKESLNSEWQGMFGSYDYKNKLKSLALAGKLRDFPRFRGVCWRVFLECLPDDVNNWLGSVSESRAQYQVLKSKYVVDPYASAVKDNVDVFNPLSQDDGSPWSQYFKDKQLNEVIVQDLERLFPGMQYFQSQRIRTVLLNILFCYARKHSSVGYKQGMHEILAPIVFVLENDSEIHPFLEDCDNLLMKKLIDPEYLEYDAFALFEQLMDIIEPWFMQTNIASKQYVDTSGLPFMQSQPTTPPTAIVRKLNKIQESMLKKYDLILYNHLRDYEIAPQLYGLRWVRVLFGREFTTIEDIFTLWDGLFADGISLDLVDYVFLSLLCHKRGKLLSSDHSECLTALMRTPFSKRGAKAVIIEAKQLRDSKLDPSALRKQKYYYDSSEQRRPPGKTEKLEPLQARVTGRPQAVIRNSKPTTQVKKTGETKPQDSKPQNPQNSKPQNYKHPHHSKPTHQPHHPTNTISVHKSTFAEEPMQNNESKSTKSVPSFHLFPHDPEDEDLFTTSPRNRTSSGGFLSKLSSKVRSPSKTDVAALQQDHERLQIQVSQFKAEVDKLQSISVYCGKKMDSYINILQREMSRDVNNMDVVYLSIAGLKQIRDLLKGTLSFQPSTVEQDSEFSHIDSVLTSLQPSVDQVNENSENSSASIPETIPVPLLADFGHFEPSNNEFILVESDNSHHADLFDDLKLELSHTNSENTLSETVQSEQLNTDFNSGKSYLESTDPLNTEGMTTN